MIDNIDNAFSKLKNLFIGEERCHLLDSNNYKLEFDVVESETWSIETFISSKTKQDGKSAGESFFNRPNTVSINATLTNHTGIDSWNPASLTKIPKASGLNIVEELVEDNITEKLSKLESWRETSESLTYYGAVKEDVKDMRITSMTFSKNSSTGDAVEISLTLQKSEVVDKKEEEAEKERSVLETKRKGRVNTITEKATVNTNNTALNLK